jgi:ATP-dependent RNA helicase DDX27
VKRLAAVSLQTPVRLAADQAFRAPKDLVQEVVRMKGHQAEQKEAALLAMCQRSLSTGRVIVFCDRKLRAHRIRVLFGLAGLPPAAELHGNMAQEDRLMSLEKFRKGELKFLICTDVAARGLDILGVETVVNFDAPKQIETYLHR